MTAFRLHLCGSASISEGHDPYGLLTFDLLYKNGKQNGTHNGVTFIFCFVIGVHCGI